MSVATVEAQTPPRESRWLEASRWLLFVTAGGLWLYTVRWSYGPLPTTLLETLILLTAGSYVIGAWRAGRRRPVATPLDIPILFLLLAGAISVVVAKDHRGALGLYRAFFLEPVALFYIGVDLLRRTQDFQRLLLGITIGSSIFAVLNFEVFLRVVAAHALRIGVAPNALYGDANYVAMYFDPIVALATGLLLFGGSTRWRLTGLVWLLIAGTAIMLTFSKGSYLALGGIAVMVVASVPRWRVPVLIGLAVVAVALSRIPPIALRLSEAYGSIMGRAQIFGATLQMIRDQPIFGVGLGGFSYHFRGRIPEVYPHDIWLTFWVETGLLGVLAFAFILLSLLWRALRSIGATSGFERGALWGVLAAFVAWTVHGVVDSPYWKNDMAAEFWILAALELAVISFVAARSGAGVRRAGPEGG
jgi:O-antigen ligase